MFEQQIGVAEGFFKRLLFDEAEDWSYIVQLHALCETAVTQAVLKRLNQSAIDDAISKLYLSKKTEIAMDLGLLKKRDKRFLERFSALRNTVAHDIKAISTFRLEQWIAAQRSDSSRAGALNQLLGSEPDNPDQAVGVSDARLALFKQMTRLLVSLDIAERAPESSRTVGELLGFKSRPNPYEAPQ